MGKENLNSKELVCQFTNTLIMVPPTHFDYDPKAAETNKEIQILKLTRDECRNVALVEFNQMVENLKNNDINVISLPSTPENVPTPAGVFPNNWFSHHSEGVVVLYPMLNPKRRNEKQLTTLLDRLEGVGIKNLETIDLSVYEKENLYLEGTGSLVLDRVNKLAYAMESPRTSEKMVDIFCSILKYQKVFFHAYDETNFPIYHTNVVMTVGEKFAVVCSEAVKNKIEKQELLDTLKNTGKEVIEINLTQLHSFCANVLQIGRQEDPKIIMSKRSFMNFSESQVELLSKFGKLISTDLDIIERGLGGGARCMLAEIFTS